MKSARIYFEIYHLIAYTIKESENDVRMNKEREIIITVDLRRWHDKIYILVLK